jgi:hypothetical protein
VNAIPDRVVPCTPVIPPTDGAGVAKPQPRAKKHAMLIHKETLQQLKAAVVPKPGSPTKKWAVVSFGVDESDIDEALG